MAKMAEKTHRGTGTKDTERQTPYMPGKAAKSRGEIPTGQHRNDEYGKGRHTGVVADDPKRRDKP